MRVRWLSVVMLGIATLAGSSWANTFSQQNDASSSAAGTATPADDPAFAGFPPVTKDMKPPKATFSPDPKFPDLPEGAEERGTVVMLIGINVKGRVQEVRVLRSDEAAFDKAAVETVKKWKFRSAMKDGHSVPVQVTVEMKFAR